MHGLFTPRNLRDMLRSSTRFFGKWCILAGNSGAPKRRRLIYAGKKTMETNSTKGVPFHMTLDAPSIVANLILVRPLTTSDLYSVLRYRMTKQLVQRIGNSMP